MSALVTRIEREAGRPLTPIEIFNISASRETTLSRLLTLYICTGLAFMLLPGTFLGVWNLIAISSRQSTQTVSSAWIQAHGPRPDLRLDRNFHSRDRVLLDPQASPPQFVRSICRVHRVGALDDWRNHSVDLHCLQLALAHTLAVVCRT